MVKARAHLGLRLCLLSLASVPPLAVVLRHPVPEGKAWVGQMLALAALWAGLWTLAVTGGAWARMRRTLLPVLALNAALGVSLLAAPDLETGLRRWGELALWSTLIPLSAAAGHDRHWATRLGGTVVLTVALVAALSVVSRSGVAGLVPLKAATFGNRNQLGQFLAIGLWPLAAWLLTRRRWPGRFAALAVAGLVLQALLLTSSKGAWMAPIGITMISL